MNVARATIHFFYAYKRPFDRSEVPDWLFRLRTKCSLAPRTVGVNGLIDLNGLKNQASCLTGGSTPGGPEGRSFST